MTHFSKCLCACILSATTIFDAFSFGEVGKTLVADSAFYNDDLQRDVGARIELEVNSAEFRDLVDLLVSGDGRKKIGIDCKVTLNLGGDIDGLHFRVFVNGLNSQVENQVAGAVVEYVQFRSIGFSKPYCTIWLIDRLRPTAQTQGKKYGPIISYILQQQPEVIPHLLTNRIDGSDGKGVEYSIYDVDFDWVYSVDLDVAGQPLQVLCRRFKKGER